MSELRYELTRKITIRALHLLSNPALGLEENKSLYGKCARLHGHDYEISVTISAEPDSQSGWLFDRERLDKILSSALVEPLDGANLNERFPNTAGEGLARAIFLRLQALFPVGMLVRVGVQETAKNYFEFPAG